MNISKIKIATRPGTGFTLVPVFLVSATTLSTGIVATVSTTGGLPKPLGGEPNDGIAFQMTTLTLNLAMEAARTDERGRSSAAVVSEAAERVQHSSVAVNEFLAPIADGLEKVAWSQIACLNG